MGKLDKANGFVRINTSLMSDANLASFIKFFFSNEKAYFGFLAEITMFLLLNGIFYF